MRDSLIAYRAKNGTQYAVHAKVLRNGRWQPFTLAGVPDDFAPHGLAGMGSLGSSKASLLVINHRTTHDTLDLFTFRSPSKAAHVASYAHPLLFNVNDCAFASAMLVYCTNWRSYETGTLADAVELYLQKPWGYVIACELRHAGDVHCEMAATGLRMANGIETHGELVFVVASLEPSIHVYARRADGTHGLELKYKMATRAACDNLMWHGTSLLTACHPRALTFTKYSKAPRQGTVSPCEVLRFDDVLNASRLQYGKGSTYPTTVAQQVYVDSLGDEYSACSVAAMDAKGALWLGSVHERGLLRCAVK